MQEEKRGFQVAVGQEVSLASIEERFEEWRIIHTQLKTLAEEEEALRMKIKTFMNQSRWEKYDSANGVKACIIQHKSTCFDENQLRIMLTEEQYFGALKTKVVEKILLTTKEDRERLNKYVRGG